MTVAVGLGSSNRGQMMQGLVTLLGLQREALPVGMATLPNIYNTLSKLVETLGLKSPELYFTAPAQDLPPGPPPDPAMVKVQADAQADAQKAENDKLKMELESFKLLMEDDRARDQMELDALFKAQELAVARAQAMATAVASDVSAAGAARGAALSERAQALAEADAGSRSAAEQRKLDQDGERLALERRRAEAGSMPRKWRARRTEDGSMVIDEVKVVTGPGREATAGNGEYRTS
jgi:hypothetical protein